MQLFLKAIFYGLSSSAKMAKVEDEKEELFVPFSDFPWFNSASVKQLFHVERLQSHHLYWPDLDIDLHVD